jgi:hypothetical protein
VEAFSQQRAAAPQSARTADRLALLLFSSLVVIAVLSAMLLLLDRPIVLFSHGPAGVRYHGGVMAMSWRSRDYAQGPAVLTDAAGQPRYGSLIALRRWDNALPRRRWERFGVRYVRDFRIGQARPSAWVADEVRTVSLRFEYVTLLLTGLCVAAFIPLGRARRRTRRVSRGLCPVCGYDLRASLYRCPECGRIPS